MIYLTLINILNETLSEKLHVSDKSCKTRSKNKPFYALKWLICDFEKRSHLIITLIITSCVEFVRKCIYCCFWNTAVYVHVIIVRYNGPQKHFRCTKSSGNLEILTSILTGKTEWSVNVILCTIYGLET